MGSVGTCPVCKAQLREPYCDHFDFTSPTCKAKEMFGMLLKSCDLHENVLVRYDEDRLLFCPLCKVEDENRRLLEHLQLRNQMLSQREDELVQTRKEVECLSTKLSQLIALQNLHASSSHGK
jgi:hypothetical protein